MQNKYSFPVSVQIIDELPIQFQYRYSDWQESLAPKESKIIHYQLRPLKRGTYSFGAIRVFVSVFSRFVERSYSFSQDQEMAVYPSIIQMKKYEFAAINNRLQQFGIKKIRKIGHTLEFEQIKNYVSGDDPRTINWKASARSYDLMVNNYQDEKSQDIYCIIDKGRLMRFPFGGLSLLDYAINSALVMANIALRKGDKMGLITYSHRLSTVLPASKKPDQLGRILESLYNQKTEYKESNVELLSLYLNKKILHRSLMLIFTNFESESSFYRQLPFLIQLGKIHSIVVIFFLNKELNDYTMEPAENVEEIYRQTIAEEFESNKYLIVKELKKRGIFSILTYPEDLSINTINKYLELKARGII